MIQQFFNDMITLLLAKFMLNDVPHAAGFYDDPIRSNKPIDYVQSIIINGIDFPSWSHWKNNWRYVPDPSEYLVLKYPRQMEAAAMVTWQRLRGEKPSLITYLDAMSNLTLDDYSELEADKWFLRIVKAL